MNPVSLVFLGLAAAVILATVANAAWIGARGEAEPAMRCGSAQFRQFDFFLGAWDACDAGSPSRIAARNEVTIILDGCAVQEDYRQNDGMHGESCSMYDASRDMWRQTWVTRHGTLLQLDGYLASGRMVLTGTETAPDGTSWLLRGIWRAGTEAVCETAERSTDGGKTWKPVLGIVFRRHPQGGGRRTVGSMHAGM